MSKESSAAFPSVTVSLGMTAFRAHLETALAPAGCQALMALLPYQGILLHARWSGEAVWSPIGDLAPAHSPPVDKIDIGNPQPGQLLLYAGLQSEPEILLAYGETRFASRAGPLLGSPVLTIVERLDELAVIGRSILENGASTLRIELIPGH